MVVVGTGGSGTAVTRKSYPNTDGLTLGTTTQKGHTILTPEEGDLRRKEWKIE